MSIRLKRLISCYTSFRRWDHSKPSTSKLPQSFDAGFVESGRYDNWLAQGHFTAAKTEGAFVMCLPPPNVTGDLHMGHAVTIAIQDTIARWRRMKGQTVIWIPGFDHAGIATQMVVRRQLEEKNTTEITRETLRLACLEWSQERQKIIRNQLHCLGASLDWSKCYYTLDDNFSELVRNSFISLHGSGRIYRRYGLVNWSTALQTTLSDFEVLAKSVSGRTSIDVPGHSNPVTFGVLYRVAYPLDTAQGQSDKSVPVATTRLETMSSDVALAVHPSDSRYTSLVGEIVRHPVTQKLLPIIADEAVDPEFGTGVLKLTPGHSMVDAKICERHGLINDYPVSFESSGLTISHGGFSDELAGLPRFSARMAVHKFLSAKDLISNELDIEQTLPVCYRSDDIVETLPKRQWFMRTDIGAERLSEVLYANELSITPDYWAKEWKEWLSRRKDWCLSRQIVWGHPIPAYLVTDTKECKSDWFVANTLTQALQEASNQWGIPTSDLSIAQDTDVLDTWFSSSLIPTYVASLSQSTNDESSQKTSPSSPPISFMETGTDILRFWVNNMALMHLELNGSLPFDHILLHGLVRDEDGRKMSKTRGNVVDPLELIKGSSVDDMEHPDKLMAKMRKGKTDDAELEGAIENLTPAYGADPVRFGLLSADIRRDSSFAPDKIRFAHTLCNKIWQSFRYLEANSTKLYNADSNLTPLEMVPLSKLSFVDKWIITELNSAIETVDEALGDSDFAAATKAITNFWRYSYCDIYLEYSKVIVTWDFVSTKAPDLNIPAPSAAALQSTLATHWTCQERCLRLIAPVMPFLSEELHQRLHSLPTARLATEQTTNADSVHLNPFPTSITIENQEHIMQLNEFGELLRVLLSSMRSLRAAIGILNKDVLEKGTIEVSSASLLNSLSQPSTDLIIRYMGRIANLDITTTSPDTLVILDPNEITLILFHDADNQLHHIAKLHLRLPDGINKADVVEKFEKQRQKCSRNRKRVSLDLKRISEFEASSATASDAIPNEKASKKQNQAMQYKMKMKESLMKQHSETTAKIQWLDEQLKVLGNENERMSAVESLA